MVARVISQTPAIGAKNLYKQVCEALGNQPNRGKAPNSREVRKIVSALKEDKGLEMVMSSVTPFTSATQRAKLIAKKIEEGPKSEDGAKKLFMGASSTLLHEPTHPLSMHTGTQLLFAAPWHSRTRLHRGGSIAMHACGGGG